MTLNPRIALSLASIAAAGALAVGATFAYFSDTETSTNNQLTTGTLNIALTDQNSNDPFINEVVIGNWQPGQDALVNFDVRNDGSLPVNLRGMATGTWGTGNESLDAQNKVKVTKVERWNGSDWEILKQDTNGITGFFYYSPTGNDDISVDGVDDELFTVSSGSRAQLRVTVTLDSTAGNAFQGKTFIASLQVDAKQTNAPSF